MDKRQKSSGSGEIAYILGCSKTKRKAPCQAWEMYQGAFFKKSLRWAKTQSRFIYILSVKYGLLDLSDWIAPYELSIWDLSKKQYTEWVVLVTSQFEEKMIPDIKIFLTPIKYAAPFAGQVPLKGLRIGERLQWINRQLMENPTKKGLF